MDDCNGGHGSFPIPHRFHFVWFGNTFPRANRLAMESCLAHCRGAEVLLWHSEELSQHADFRALLQSGLQARRLDADSAFGPATEAQRAPFDVPRLKQIWNAVASHVTRSNLARAILLYRYGGIYLDTDVLVVRDFEALRQHEAFVGTERVVWPASATRGWSVQRLLKSPLLDLLRKLSAALRDGEWLIRKTANWYPTAVNGAVFGARPGHPFLAELLRKTSEVSEDKWPLKHRLGTHVLQDTVAGYLASDLKILGPDSFYPLGPEISRQYFREQSDPAKFAQRIVGPDTCAIHWYASVTDLSSFSDAQWGKLMGRTIYGHLCAPYLDSAAAQ